MVSSFKCAKGTFDSKVPRRMRFLPTDTWPNRIVEERVPTLRTVSSLVISPNDTHPPESENPGDGRIHAGMSHNHHFVEHFVMRFRRANFQPLQGSLPIGFWNTVRLDSSRMLTARVEIGLLDRREQHWS